MKLLTEYRERFLGVEYTKEENDNEKQPRMKS